MYSYFLLLQVVHWASFIPELIQLLNLQDVAFLEKPYVDAILGAILFFLVTFWIVDYIVELIRRVEEALLKAPVTDVLLVA